MTDTTLAAAIRAAVEAQGVAWGGRTRVASPETLADGLTDALRHADGMTSRECVAAIVGECAQETDWYCSLVEYGGANARYAPYYGRGCIQCTWEVNYRACGDWAGKLGYPTSGADMAANPAKMATMPYAWLSAVWYFASRIPARYWQQRNWNAISGLINAGNASYYVPAYELRAKSINAALAVLERNNWTYTGGDDMPTAQEVADAVWAKTVTIAGNPKNKGKQVPMSVIMAWLDDQFSNIPAAVWGHDVKRAGLPDSDPRQGKAVSVGTIMAYQDAFVANIVQVVQDAVATITDDTTAQKVVDAVNNAMSEYIRLREAEPGTIAAAPLADNIHVVQKGETLKAIAAAAGSTVEAFVAANPGLEPNALVAGQKLTIPTETEES